MWNSQVAMLSILLLILPTPGEAQEDAAAGFAELELARSRGCVVYAARMAELNQRLEPFALRFDRLRLLAQGVALEDAAVLDSLDASDPVELAVREWFAADGALARRYVEEQDEALMAQRSAAKEAINTLLRETGDSVQINARTLLEAESDIAAGAANCEGAILVRSAVLEACRTEQGPLCDAAAAAEPGGVFRFVESPEDLWDLEQVRPWSESTPLQLSQEGQLVGSRTVSTTRRGNVVLTASVGPLLRDRSQLSPELIQHFEETLDSMGITFEHPQLVFAPALDVQANVPEPLAGETAYVLHFGTIAEAEVIFTGPAGTGEPFHASVMLTPSQADQLRSGAPLSLSAIRELEDGNPGLVLSIEITSINQAFVMGTLLEYMAAQFSTDLGRLLPGGG